VLSVFGAGLQAHAHVEALMMIHPFNRALVCARSGAAEFADWITEKFHMSAQATDAATAASQGCLQRWLKRGNLPAPPLVSLILHAWLSLVNC
jgi:ornithine cyclodeaminase